MSARRQAYGSSLSQRELHAERGDRDATLHRLSTCMSIWLPERSVTGYSESPEWTLDTLVQTSWFSPVRRSKHREGVDRTVSTQQGMGPD